MNILIAHDQGWKQELSPYNQYEKEKTPNLESVFEEFMAYHASSKANQNSMKNHEIHFGKSYSIENFQGDQSYNLTIKMKQKEVPIWINC